MKLSAGRGSLGAAAEDIGNAVLFLQTQDGVLSVAGKILARMSASHAQHRPHQELREHRQLQRGVHE
jgi:hypothetical protein